MNYGFLLLLVASSWVVARSLQSYEKQTYFLKKNVTLQDPAKSVDFIITKAPSEFLLIYSWMK